MALVKKLYDGNTIEIQGIGNIVLEDVLAATGGADLSDLTPIQREYYLKIYEALAEGRGRILANGNIEITDDASLDNVHIGENGKFVQPDGTGWGYKVGRTGVDNFKSGLFTSRGTKNLRAKDYDIAKAVDAFNARIFVAAQNKALRTPEAFDLEEKAKLDEKNSKLFTPDSYTVRLAMAMIGASDGKTFSKQFNSLYKTPESRQQFVKDLLQYMIDNPNYDKYNFGDKYTLDTLLKTLRDYNTLFTSETREDSYLLDYWKYGLGDLGVFINGNQEELEGQPDLNSLLELYPEDLRGTVKNNILEKLYEQLLLAAKDAYNKLLSVNSDARWNAHLTTLEPLNNLKLWNLGNLPTGAFNFTQETYNKALTALNNVTKLAHTADPNAEWYTKYKGNFLYIYQTMDYLYKNLLLEALKKFPEVTYKGEKYNVIMDSAQRNGVFFIFRKHPTNGQLEVKLAHASQFGGQSYSNGSTTTDFLEDYKTGYLKEIEDEYRKNHPAPTIEDLNLPEFKNGGLIAYMFKGGDVSRNLGIKDPKLVAAEQLKATLLNDEVERRVIKTPELESMDLTSSDYMRLASVVADVGSLFGGWGAALSVGSTGLLAMADFTDEGVSSSEAWKNLGINTALSIGSILPGVGVFKAAKGLKLIVHLVPWILGSIGTIASFSELPDIALSWKNISNGNYTSRDVQLAAQSAFMAFSALKAGKTNLKAHHMGKATPNSSKTTIKTKTGDVEISDAHLKTLNTAYENNKGNYKKVNKVFLGLNPSYKGLELPGTDRKIFTTNTNRFFKPLKAKITTNTTNKLGSTYVIDGYLYTSDPLIRSIYNSQMHLSLPGWLRTPIYGKRTPVPTLTKPSRKPRRKKTLNASVTSNKLGGSLNSTKNVVKMEIGGVTRKNSESWYSRIGSKTLNYFILKMKEDPRLIKTIVDELNKFLDRHSAIYKASGYTDGKVAWKDPDRNVEAYQKDYNDAGYNKEFIWPLYGNYQSVGTNPGNLDNALGGGVDNLYASITDDRRLLGRLGDFTDEQLNHFKDEFKKLGVGFDLDSNGSNYYKLSLLERVKGNNDAELQAAREMIEEDPTLGEFESMHLGALGEDYDHYTELPEKEQKEIQQNAKGTTQLTGTHIDQNLTPKKISDFNRNMGYGVAEMKKAINKYAFSKLNWDYLILQLLTLHKKVYSPNYYGTLHQLKENAAFTRLQGEQMSDLAMRNATYAANNKQALAQIFAMDLDRNNNIHQQLLDILNLENSLREKNNQIAYQNDAQRVAAAKEKGRAEYDLAQALGRLTTDPIDQDRELWLARRDNAQSINGLAALYALKNKLIGLSEYIKYLNNLNGGGIGYVNEILPISFVKEGGKTKKDRTLIAQANNNSRALDKQISNFLATMNKKKKK